MTATSEGRPVGVGRGRPAARRQALVELAGALVDGRWPAAHRALAAAVETGALIGPAGGVLTPASRLAADDLPAEFQPWLQRGLLPFRVKSVDCPADRREPLRRLLVAVADRPELGCVPHWVLADRMLTLQLPAATDLRQLLAVRPAAGREWVHRTCLESLAAFADRDGQLRATLAERPEPFPVVDRYRTARAALVRLLGPVDLPAELPAPVGRSTLFCDPKPANFVLPRSASDRPASDCPTAGWPVRIDLDLLRYACPVSLQLVLALYAHPVALPEQGPGEVGFAGLLADARAAAGRFGVADEELEAMIRYHLLRNFSSAAAGDSAADRAKARALAPVLRAACTELPSLPVAAGTASRLADWQHAHPPERSRG